MKNLVIFVSFCSLATAVVDRGWRVFVRPQVPHALVGWGLLFEIVAGAVVHRRCRHFIPTRRWLDFVILEHFPW